MHKHEQVLKLMGSHHYKSLVLTSEDFFLFCDPPVSPAFAFLFSGAAAAGATGSDVVATSEDLVSAAARLGTIPALAQALRLVSPMGRLPLLLPPPVR